MNLSDKATVAAKAPEKKALIASEVAFGLPARYAWTKAG